MKSEWQIFFNPVAEFVQVKWFPDKISGTSSQYYLVRRGMRRHYDNWYMVGTFLRF